MRNNGNGHKNGEGIGLQLDPLGLVNEADTVCSSCIEVIREALMPGPKNYEDDTEKRPDSEHSDSHRQMFREALPFLTDLIWNKVLKRSCFHEYLATTDSEP